MTVIDLVDPHGLLAHVHPDLVKVIRAARQAPFRFRVVYGLRTEAAEWEAVKSGHSQTLHSRHLPNKDGLACAIDFCVVDATGALDWRVSNAQGGAFAGVAQQIEAAAQDLRVPIEWGGAAVGAWVPGQVSHFHDWGHVQLPWAEYP